MYLLRIIEGLGKLNSQGLSHLCVGMVYAVCVAALKCKACLPVCQAMGL